MAAVQLRAMYARIGFTNGANDNIVDVQGIDSVRELGYLNDDDVINLCKTIRRPGGHLPNPAFVLEETSCLRFRTPESWSPNVQRPTCSWPHTPSGTTTGSVGQRPSLP